MSNEEFQNRWDKIETSSLFFYLVSKGNPGPAGSGGVLLDYSGKIVINFSWGLGQRTNNTTEILAIWQGLKQARRLSIKKLAIIGDS